VIGGLVLAAGAGRRMGEIKQLTALQGRPLLEHALSSMAASSVDVAVVTLGAHSTQILAGIDLCGAHPVVCGDWVKGQSASLRTGLHVFGSRIDAVVITLGDQPLITAAAIDRLVQARDGRTPLRASYAGRPGHPVLLERAQFAAAAQLTGDTGARSLMRSWSPRLVACDGLGSSADADTPAELAELLELADPASALR
jgi:CTP:molybdopterin cytidylyltransferase MocA